jgi:hypothetical protein
MICWRTSSASSFRCGIFPIRFDIVFQSLCIGFANVIAVFDQVQAVLAAGTDDAHRDRHIPTQLAELAASWDREGPVWQDQTVIRPDRPPRAACRSVCRGSPWPILLPKRSNWVTAVILSYSRRSRPGDCEPTMLTFEHVYIVHGRSTDGSDEGHGASAD